jgi:Proto-chlorophyllide reductase 57 kD subunit
MLQGAVWINAQGRVASSRERRSDHRLSCRMRERALFKERDTLSDEQQITWDPEADRRIKRSPFMMRRFIRKRIEERVVSRGRTHVTEADVDESARMYRQYRFK